MKRITLERLTHGDGVWHALPIISVVVNTNSKMIHIEAQFLKWGALVGINYKRNK